MIVPLNRFNFYGSGASEPRWHPTNRHDFFDFVPDVCPGLINSGLRIIEQRNKQNKQTTQKSQL